MRLRLYSHCQVERSKKGLEVSGTDAMSGVVGAIAIGSLVAGAGELLGSLAVCI